MQENTSRKHCAIKKTVKTTVDGDEMTMITVAILYHSRHKCKDFRCIHVNPIKIDF